MASIGKQLNKAREDKDLSIDDVAFRTHIPAARLQELENDDFSNFANLTYAKGFLKLYSRFLDVDLSGYLAEFDTRDLASVTGHEYIQTARATHSLPQATVFEEPPRNGLWVLLGGVAAAIGITVYFFRSGGDEPQESAPGEGIAAGSPAVPAPPSTGSPDATPGASEKVPPKASVVPEEPESGGGGDAASSSGNPPGEVEIRRAAAPSSLKAVVVDSSEEDEADSDAPEPDEGPATAGARP